VPFENHLKTLRWCIKKISESFKSLRKGEITVPLGFIFKLEIFEGFFNKALMMSVLLPSEFEKEKGYISK